jgi:hypothetical protein
MNISKFKDFNTIRSAKNELDFLYDIKKLNYKNSFLSDITILNSKYLEILDEIEKFKRWFEDVT